MQQLLWASFPRPRPLPPSPRLAFWPLSHVLPPWWLCCCSTFGRSGSPSSTARGSAAKDLTLLCRFWSGSPFLESEQCRSPLTSRRSGNMAFFQGSEQNVPLQGCSRRALFLPSPPGAILGLPDSLRSKLAPHGFPSLLCLASVLSNEKEREEWVMWA